METGLTLGVASRGGVGVDMGRGDTQGDVFSGVHVVWDFWSRVSLRKLMSVGEIFRGIVLANEVFGLAQTPMFSFEIERINGAPKKSKRREL